MSVDYLAAFFLGTCASAPRQRVVPVAFVCESIRGKQLVVQRTEYLAELQQTEDASKQLRTKADDLRRKLSAIDTLLGLAETSAHQFHTEAEPLGPDVNDGAFTPIQATGTDSP